MSVLLGFERTFGDREPRVMLYEQNRRGYNTNYTVIMTGGVIASIPALILYVFAQRYIIQGVSRSGLKG